MLLDLNADSIFVVFISLPDWTTTAFNCPTPPLV